MTIYQPFDLLFIRGNSIVSNSIKKLSKSEFSHVAIYYKPDHIFETDYKFPFSLRHLNYSKDQIEIYRYKYDLSLENRYNMVKFLEESKGMEYDWMKTVSNGLFILFKFPILNAANRLNCVESVKELYNSGGVNLEGNTPEQLRNNSCLEKVEVC